ncbi:MAG: hypothetical protein KQ78_01208 [Candidatus Izimaplasma bacterium HR2]|nr:MAG: hypothetical protein KQ78_01208 [Candidatus Izimaplasma bacterium HR2]
MALVDVSITRSLTVNVGNYESIKPTVTLTARDINPIDISGVYSAIDTAITGLIKFEIINCISESKLVNSGIDQHCKNVIKNSEEIGNEIEIALSKLEHF